MIKHIISTHRDINALQELVSQGKARVVKEYSHGKVKYFAETASGEFLADISGRHKHMSESMMLRLK